MNSDLNPTPTPESISMRPPWWLIGLLMLLCGAVIAWRIPPLFRAIEEKRKLDTEGAFVNGFQLSEELKVDPTLIRFGSPEEIIPIDEAPIWDTKTVANLGENFRTRFLVSESEVVGVVINGKARAYPIRILQWHEVVNDALGEKPICVIHHPLSETTTVFRRPESKNSEPVLFGSSGLTVDCCLLIHDRLGSNARSNESLWSPVDGAAISGDRSGQQLELVAFQLTTWKKWLAAHPETDVLGMLESHRRYYKKEPYSPYRLVDKPRYPYSPEPPASPRANLSRVILTREEGEWCARTPDGSQNSSAWVSENKPFPHVITSWFAIHAREIPLRLP
ncbi:MAG: DUF3179 domain-containing (seleno)protein [Planctomycetota bacterium]